MIKFESDSENKINSTPQGFLKLLLLFLPLAFIANFIVNNAIINIFNLLNGNHLQLLIVGQLCKSKSPIITIFGFIIYLSFLLGKLVLIKLLIDYSIKKRFLSLSIACGAFVLIEVLAMLVLVFDNVFGTIIFKYFFSINMQFSLFYVFGFVGILPNILFSAILLRWVFKSFKLLKFLP